MTKDINKRESIIKTAEKLFYSIGINETTMDKLAKESGFTKRTLYSYFNSKEDIYYEVMLKSFNELNSLVRNILNENRDVSSIDRIRILGKCLIEFSTMNSSGFKAIFDFQNKDIENILNNETAMKCYEEGQYLVEIMLDALNKGVKSGELKKDIDVNKIFIVLWGVIVGMTNLINYKTDYIEKYLGENMESVLNYSYDIFFEAIKN